MHHANIILDKTGSRDFIFGILKNDLNFEHQANPDFLFWESESFGIDDARDLEKWAIGRPLIGETKVFFLVAKSITNEAQNAMLKVLEEPPLGTYFFICIENFGGLLPTFISRTMILDSENGKDLKNLDLVRKFLSAKIKDRVAIIKSLAKKENKTEIKEFIKDMEKISDEIPLNSAKKVLAAKFFATARGASPKMILEWLACML